MRPHLHIRWKFVPISDGPLRNIPMLKVICKFKTCWRQSYKPCRIDLENNVWWKQVKCDNDLVIELTKLWRQRVVCHHTIPLLRKMTKGICDRRISSCFHVVVILQSKQSSMTHNESPPKKTNPFTTSCRDSYNNRNVHPLVVVHSTFHP